MIVSTLLASLTIAGQGVAGYAGKPFEDEFHRTGPANIPGIVQCGLYDLGGEGVGYHDKDEINHGSGELNREPGHQRAHAGDYVWHFREKEGVDLSFVKDWADLNHPNPVSPAINQHYIGWTEDGEWTNYTVNVAKPGWYRIKAMYSYKANPVRFDVDFKPVAKAKLPVETANWHTWNYAEIGRIEFKTPGLHVLTFHYGWGNNFAYFAFERV